MYLYHKFVLNYQIVEILKGRNLIVIVMIHMLKLVLDVQQLQFQTDLS